MPWWILLGIALLSLALAVSWLPAARPTEAQPIRLKPDIALPHWGLIDLAVWVGIAALLAALILPNFVKARSRGELIACKSNLKNIGTALELFSKDHQGSYPPTLQALVPRYLRVLPECPDQRTDTYSRSYRRAEAAYTFFCQGKHHEESGITTPDYPQYNSRQGLVERP